MKASGLTLRAILKKCRDRAEIHTRAAPRSTQGAYLSCNFNVTSGISTACLACDRATARGCRTPTCPPVSRHRGNISASISRRMPLGAFSANSSASLGDRRRLRRVPRRIIRQLVAARRINRRIGAGLHAGARLTARVILPRDPPRYCRFTSSPSPMRAQLPLAMRSRTWAHSVRPFPRMLNRRDPIQVHSVWPLRLRPLPRVLRFVAWIHRRMRKGARPPRRRCVAAADPVRTVCAGAGARMPRRVRLLPSDRPRPRVRPTFLIRQPPHLR